MLIVSPLLSSFCVLMTRPLQLRYAKCPFRDVLLLNSCITAYPYITLQYCIIVWRSRRTADDGKQTLPQEAAARSQDSFTLAGSRPGKISGSEQPEFSRRSAWIPPHNRLVH